MDVFVARQPIFDTHQRVVAYELLYRSKDSGQANVLDGDAATGDVIVNALTNIGVERLTEGKKAFVNFTRRLLVDEIPTIFSKDHLVVEVLENLAVDETLLTHLRALRKKGYTIALDDFTIDYPHPEIFDLVDIVKVDFMETDVLERAYIVEMFKGKNVRLLAEKVETMEVFVDARLMGFHLFQGFFFARPQVMSAKEFDVSSNIYLKVYEEASRTEPDFNLIASTVGYDASLSYRLLTLVNSPAFANRNRIKTVKHALTLLGFKEIRKWIMLLMLRDVGGNKPPELIKSSLVRARFLESLAASFDLRGREEECFMLGLFSHLDVLLERPFEVVLEKINVTKDVRAALERRGDNALEPLLDFCRSYERGEWRAIAGNLDRIERAGVSVLDQYLRAITFADRVFKKE
jgi:EAL and modified HD-GYP domain-containing signal transduction protein